MYVAELNLTEQRFSGNAVIHRVRFEDVAQAKAEFDRVAALIGRREERKNDMPKMLEITNGEAERVSIPIDVVGSIGFIDYAQANAKLAGVRDAFPNMFKF